MTRPSMRRPHYRLALLVLLVLLLGAPPVVRANDDSAPGDVPEGLRGVGIDQRLDAQVPLDLPFVDAHGRAVRLGDVVGERPVVLTLVYYRCPMLCNLALNGLLRTLRAMRFSAGEEFDVVTVSFDPREGSDLAAEKKRSYLAKYERPGAEDGWRFLTGEEDATRRLAEAVGFRYRYDEESGEYAHASALIVLTPAGRVARYFYGVEYSPRDLRLSLVEAADEKIGSPVDQVLLYCFRYDPSTGRYSLAILRVIRAAGVATVVAIAVFVGLSILRERVRSRKARPRAAEEAS